MKKLLTMVLAGMMMLPVVSPAVAQGPHRGGRGGGSPYHGYYGGHGRYYGGYGGGHHHGDHGWAVIGQLLTGCLIGGIIGSACYAEPPRREVVYMQPVYY